MKTLVLILANLLLGGCAAHALRCDAQLRPINPAAPGAAAGLHRQLSP